MIANDRLIDIILNMNNIKVSIVIDCKRKSQEHLHASLLIAIMMIDNQIVIGSKFHQLILEILG